MKPYGLPRNHDVGSPDVGDIHQYGLKSCTGRLRGKGGDIRSMFKSAADKARSRRTWKRAARRANRAACTEID
jgi:hypothetical protein